MLEHMYPTSYNGPPVSFWCGAKTFNRLTYVHIVIYCIYVHVQYIHTYNKITCTDMYVCRYGVSSEIDRLTPRSNAFFWSNLEICHSLRPKQINFSEYAHTNYHFPTTRKRQDQTAMGLDRAQMNWRPLSIRGFSNQPLWEQMFSYT